jgi:hypothetical protein
MNVESICNLTCMLKMLSMNICVIWCYDSYSPWSIIIHFAKCVPACDTTMTRDMSKIHNQWLWIWFIRTDLDLVITFWCFDEFLRNKRPSVPNKNVKYTKKIRVITSPEVIPTHWRSRLYKQYYNIFQDKRNAENINGGHSCVYVKTLALQNKKVII